MSKRKRIFSSDEDVELDDPTNRTLRAQGERLKQSLIDGQKSLSRALKLARGFERQKLGRRQKTSKERCNDTETARIGAEILALKVCEL